MGEWRKLQLGRILTESKIPSDSPNPDRRITVRLHVKGVEKRPLADEKSGATRYFIRKSGQFIYGKQNFHKGAFGIIPPELDNFESSLDLPAFDLDESCQPEWLVYSLRAGSKYENLSKVARGAGSQRVSVEDFLQSDILLPGIQEQRIILGRIKLLEGYLSSIDSEKESQLGLLKQLRQTVLQEAVEGKLTAEWRKQHPMVKGDPQFDAAALLAQIKAEKERLAKGGKIRKEKPLPLIADEDKPFDLPEGWVWCRFGSYSRFERGRFSIRPRNDPRYFGGPYPFVQIGGLSEAGEPISTALQSLNEKGLAASKMFEAGTILIAIVGGTIGNLGVLKTPMCFPDSIVGVRPANLNCHDYVLYLLRQCQPEIRRLAYQMAGQPNIKLPTLEELLIPLPPLAEQQAIVARVDSLMAVIDELEKQVAERKEQAQLLMQTVLREAFDGEKLL